MTNQRQAAKSRQGVVGEEDRCADEGKPLDKIETQWSIQVQVWLMKVWSHMHAHKQTHTQTYAHRRKETWEPVR